jgi:hypothetical protein
LGTLLNVPRGNPLVLIELFRIVLVVGELVAPPVTPSTSEKFLLLTELPNMNVATRVASVWRASKRISSISPRCSA